MCCRRPLRVVAGGPVSEAITSKQREFCEIFAQSCNKFGRATSITVFYIPRTHVKLIKAANPVSLVVTGYR